MGVRKIASNIFQALGPINALTGIRTKLGLIKKRNVEYFQIKDQLQEEYFMDWSQCLFLEKLFSQY